MLTSHFEVNIVDHSYLIQSGPGKMVDSRSENFIWKQKTCFCDNHGVNNQWAIKFSL